MSHIKDDIDINNDGIRDFDIERIKYFVFAVMKCIIDRARDYSNYRESLIQQFEIKQIARNYCSNYIANNPPKLEYK